MAASRDTETRERSVPPEIMRELLTHLLEHILLELAVQVGQEGGVGVDYHQRGQRLPRGPSVLLPDDSPQLYHRLHAPHTRLDVLIARLHKPITPTPSGLLLQCSPCSAKAQPADFHPELLGCGKGQAGAG